MKLITSPSEVDTTPVLEPVAYHLVWFGDPIDHVILCLASLLKTQSNPVITLWTSDLYVERLRRRLCPIFAGHPFCVEVFRSEIAGVLYPTEPDDKFWTCDDWRLDILYTHGGIYVDMDTLALKDISWVSRTRAMSRWGLEDRCNSSIASFPKGDSELLKLLQSMGTMGPRKGWHRAVPNIRWDFLDIDMLCFHPVFFDCGWGGGGVGCDAFFATIPDGDDPFVGSYVFHWHNRWTHPVRSPTTLVGRYWKAFVTDCFHGVDDE